MDFKFWKNKKVLVTGNTGFKGSWLSLYLQHLGAEVIGYSLPAPTKPALFHLALLDQTIKTYFSDVRDYEKLQSVLKEEKPEIVLHLAAQPLVRASYLNPIETYSTNVMGTVNLLEAIRFCDSVRSVVVVTSDKCYENKEWLWAYRENEAMGGYDPYSNSKGCAELVVSSYRNSFFNFNEYQKHGVALASARAGNVIGGGDWSEDRLVVDMMSALLNNQNPSIRNPNAIRPWQHVLEPLTGYLLLAQKLCLGDKSYSEAFNFGPSEEDVQTVSWIVNKLCQLWGTQELKWQQSSSSLHEATYLKLDSSKARSVLGWRPKLNLEKALTWVVEWYQNYQQNEDLKKYSFKQIEQYLLLIKP